MGSAAALAAVAVLACLPAAAEDDAASHAGTPVRAVRLSSAEGHVKVVQDGQVIADPALANQPIFEGAQVITGSDGRAEVQLEDGSVARLSPNTTLTFTVLQQQGTGTRTELVMNSGLAYFELQPSNAEHSLKLNYGDAGFTASAFSVVRLLEDNPPGELAVFSGSVHLEAGESVQVDVHGGESLALNATDPSQYNLSETIAPDSWDSWNSDRDQALTSESTEKTDATAEMGNYPAEGLSDLDANGNWYDVPGQGYVWSPYEAQSVGAAWDPYGYGHWVWYPRFGFVWVSGYGWGYAPFQCGLWNYYDNFGWGWVPGAGCTPWGGFGLGWYGGDGGLYGEGGWYNIGTAPHSYHPPKRPMPGPIHPLPVPRGRTGAGMTVVAVDRRPAEIIGLSHPGRNPEPVIIGGHKVEPLKPLAPRTAYSRTGGGELNRTIPIVQPSGSRPGYERGIAPLAGYPVVTYPGSPVGSGGGSGTVVRPAAPVGGGYHPPAPTSHPAPAPAPSHPAPSGGGGGGGGGHAPSGGGGSSGGGSHK